MPFQAVKRFLDGAGTWGTLLGMVLPRCSVTRRKAASIPHGSYTLVALLAVSVAGTSACNDSSNLDRNPSAGGTPEQPPAHICDAPAPFPLPATSAVVGTGTEASCTFEALKAAVTGGGSISFDCGASPVSIAVTEELSVKADSIIDGGGKVTLDGGGKNRILDVGSNHSLSVRSLRFIGGKAADSDDDATGIGGAVAGEWKSRVEVIDCTFEDNVASRGGGAVSVWTGSELTIVSSVFLRNQSHYGGAVYSLLSPLTVINSVFDSNFTTTDTEMGDGGAIGTDGASESPDDDLGGDVVICGSTIKNSQGHGSGGGAYVWVYPPDRVIVERTQIEGNDAGVNAKGEGGLGGAMRISNGAIFVRDSSFLSNSSVGNGGAFYLDCAPSCTLSNSTFAGNDSKTYGGAIFGDGYRASNVTFASNHAGGHGGALFGKDFELYNSIFLDNSSGNPWNQAMNCSSTGTGKGVLQWRTETADGGGDTCIEAPLVGDPRLAPLADNGGPTKTMLPSSESAALGTGSECETTDQRGESRDPSHCDLGAVEAP